ncbi:unnamed protein product [Rhizophagus irregularis]|nr:unnamed protein product [Rhizophagus irregularis]
MMPPLYHATDILSLSILNYSTPETVALISVSPIPQELTSSKVLQQTKEKPPLRTNRVLSLVSVCTSIFMELTEPEIS